GSPVSEIAELSPATSAITITKTATTSAIPPPVIAVEIRRTSKLRTLYLSGIAISHPIVLNCAQYLCPSASALRSLCHPERSPFLCHPERSLRSRRTPVSTSTGEGSTDVELVCELPSPNSRGLASTSPKGRGKIPHS